MTPPATAAARSLGRSTSGESRPGARRQSPRQRPVRHPRRISGPARPAAAAVAAVALPAPRVTLPAPARRVRPGIALRAVAALDGVSRSALLERLIRGRVWIGLLAFALIGIVAMQLIVLKLNTEIGGILRREISLQRANAQLGIEDSEGSSGGRVEPLATAAGMTFTAPGTLRFLSVERSQLRRALAALSTPVQRAPAEAQAGSAPSGEASAGGAPTAPEG